jgi:hypothetical protein
LPYQAFHIFKNTDNGEDGVLLNETAMGIKQTPWLYGRAPLSKKVFHCEKDMIFRLGPTTAAGEEVFGSNRKPLSIWWDLKNKKNGFKHPTTTAFNQVSREINMDWWPAVYVYHVTPDSDTAATISFNYDYTVYYRDPLH